MYIYIYGRKGILYLYIYIYTHTQIYTQGPTAVLNPQLLGLRAILGLRLYASGPEDSADNVLVCSNSVIRLI